MSPRPFGTALPKWWTSQTRRRALAMWRDGATIEDIMATFCRSYRSVEQMLAAYRDVPRPCPPLGPAYAEYQRHLARHQIAVQIAAVKREARRTDAYKAGRLVW
jgi:hypothetical protein